MLALSMLLVLQNSFAQGNSVKNAKEEPFQDSILVGKGFGGRIYTSNGSSIYMNGFILPLASFLVSYRSEKADEKNVAYAFLLGVADATEGKMWCSQGGYEPTTIFKTLDEGINQLKLPRHKERAAYVITGILEKKYPCKNGDVLPKPSTQDAKDEAFQESILTGESVSGEQVIRQGEAIFVPNLPLRRFLASYQSESPGEKDVASAFLLGVMDATENKMWCSYRLFKTITLFETVEPALRKLNPSRYDERAAHVITGIFEDQFSRFCKKEH